MMTSPTSEEAAATSQFPPILPQFFTMSLPPYGSVLNVRPEILDPRGLLDMVDVGLVSGARARGLAGQGPGIDVQKDPAAFFDITYPTFEIVETLRTIARRAATPEAVPGTILLSGRYGHGKSHVLLAAHHALNAPEVASAWATRWRLLNLSLPANPIVITRSFIQHSIESLWDMLLKSLSPGRKQKIGDYPDGELIGSLLGDRPVFVIMDELERWYDAQDELNKSRNRNFLQALTEVSMRDGRLTVLTSILGEKQEPGETIRRVRPLELSFRSAEDRQRVALFRLFSDRDSDAARQAAEAAADAYLATWQSAGLRGIDGLRTRLIDCWPFTPEFFDILTKKVPNQGGFQNIRGTLRFLGHVVRATHTRRPMVSSQDLPFREREVHDALANLDTSGGEVIRRALGDNYEAVPKDLPHCDELFSTLAFYSVADPTHPGATLDELLLATLDPGENPLRIRDALAQLKQRAFNLHERDERFAFLAIENPHARINAMAGSQLVTNPAARQHICDSLAHSWGGSERTILHMAGDWETTQQNLRKLRARRPRIVLSTATLSPKERLKLQNLDEDRNLVLLVEPRVHTSPGDTNYSVVSDDALILHARRIEACKLLLEGRPAPETSKVYRQVQDDETNRLRKGVSERFGVAISWHRAGATGAEVDDSWYEVCRLDTPTAEALLDMWRTDRTGQPEIEHEIRARWTEFRTRSIAELTTWFDRTPGLPMPMEASWVPAAVRKLAQEGVFGLVGADGAVIQPKRLSQLDDNALASCTLADPSPKVPEPPEVEQPLTHLRATAQYEAASHGVRVSWAYPPVPEGSSFNTLVQRYTSARSWELGQSYPIDTGQTHEANRYHGADESFLDTERLQPGEWYHYYVFLVHTKPDGRAIFTLSIRCDVGIPGAEPRQPGIIQTGRHPDPNKLLAEVERLVMSGKHMTANSVVRKIELHIRAITDPAVREHLAGRLPERAGPNLEAAADVTFVSRGAFSRQEVLALVRLAPRYAGANYAAVLYLQEDPPASTRS